MEYTRNGNWITPEMGMGLTINLSYWFSRAVGGVASQVELALLSGCVLHAWEEEVGGEGLGGDWRLIGQAAAVRGAVWKERELMTHCHKQRLCKQLITSHATAVRITL